MPRGGRRIGSGRKPDPNSVRSRRRRQQSGLVLLHSSASRHVPAAPLEPPPQLEIPASLSAEAQKVWQRQAPFALANRTLSATSAVAFERYCELVVLEMRESKSSGVGGPNHRGLLRQINALELQFMLTPAGRPLTSTTDGAATGKPSADDDFFEPRAPLPFPTTRTT